MRDALRQADKVGVGQVTMRGKEYLVAIKPCGDGLLLETLHYADEIKNAEPLFEGIEDDESDGDVLDVAKQLIERKSAPFDAAAYHDNYSEALKALVEAKTKSKSTKKVSTDDDDERPSGTNVVDLMAALKRSLEKAPKGKKAAASKSRKKAAPKKKSA